MSGDYKRIPLGTPAVGNLALRADYFDIVKAPIDEIQHRLSVSRVFIGLCGNVV